MWFYTHSNCPLCRAPVRVDVPVNPPKTLEQAAVAVAVAEPAGSEPPITVIGMSSLSATATASSSSSSSSSLKTESCPMKRLELVEVGILVEFPPGENRLTGGPDAGSEGFSSQICVAGERSGKTGGVSKDGIVYVNVAIIHCEAWTTLPLNPYTF
ncbi:hypothetical protein Golax_014083, partial [Gossypium laxum]|nr:hypothetical protein [Gossypium laxum]